MLLKLLLLLASFILLCSCTGAVELQQSADQIVDAAQLRTVLIDSWQAYKTKFISTDGRVIDPMINQGTTSEGQSYAMLRAAWLDDAPTFDKVWMWTQNNLSQSDTHLFAWKWGQLADKSWGVLSKNSASDADQDIALALLIAGQRLHNQKYIEQAEVVIGAIWNSEVVETRGQGYLVAGNWARTQKKPRLNPSYLAPYIYRAFAKFDTVHNWNSLVETSYDVLNQVLSQTGTGLPADWCELDLSSGAVSIDKSSKDSNYSYDAMRVPWRVAMDWKWNSEPRAKEVLKKMSFLLNSWRTLGTIRSTYSADGAVGSSDQPLAGFGCVLPMFQILAPDAEKQVMNERLMSQYNNGLWRPENNYYDQNWVWFGLAAVAEKLTLPKL